MVPLFRRNLRHQTQLSHPICAQRCILAYKTLHSGSMPAGANPLRRVTDFFGLKRNLVILLLAIFVIGAGEELWMRFVPKYLKELGAGFFVIGLYDALRTLLGAVYAYPGGIVVDRWGHRRAFLAFNIVSIIGYA